MKEFVFRLYTKVLYGEGVAKRLGAECKQLNARKVFFVTDSFMVEHSAAFPMLIDSIKNAGLEVKVFSEVEPDPSIVTIDGVAAKMKEFGADVAVAFGGGSPMDTAKLACMLQSNAGSVCDYMRKTRNIDNPAVPVICIPTTAGTGSEVTSFGVVTDSDAGEKIGVAHDSMMPKLAIIDPALQLSMPPSLTAATGMDALCHAIEAFVSTDAELLSDAMCLHAIRLIGENIRKAVADGRDVETRGKMALASLAAGVGFAQAGLGAVHGIAHCLGAMYHVPHGVANALMLPYVMSFNVMASMEKFREIAIALGENVTGLSLRDAAYRSVAAVKLLNEDLGIPQTLKEVGVKESDFSSIIKNTMTYGRLPFNPRTVTEKDVENILTTAMG
ncbi:iron-containing alcohol dehydrogenase [Sporomusa sp. KB1]|jgi:alcohol dehydrogenase|uniref:iron-containing alcohol dehydrogenase n=1 Tax=Sporomusa sp. KB1 TaxID=943346 RepID=UPI0011A48FB1|nr:iron-containing alcohol dehydrogenase [Sporomusa sp. KB1]TWH52021.1 alcohol dehydrogenase class IV [Sporomusa sp. KB1]